MAHLCRCCERREAQRAGKHAEGEAKIFVDDPISEGSTQPQRARGDRDLAHAHPACRRAALQRSFGV